MADYKNKAKKYTDKNTSSLSSDPMTRAYSIPPEFDGIDSLVTRPKVEIPYRIPEPEDTTWAQQEQPKKKVIIDYPKKEKLNMEDIDIEGESRPADPMTAVSQDMTREPSSRMNQETRNVLAHLVAAGLPTVSGLVSGAAPSVMMNHYDKSNAYAKQASQYLVPSKSNLVGLMDEEGNPYYEIDANAQGKTPYVKPSAVAAAKGMTGPNGEALFQVRTVEDEYGRPRIVGITKSGGQVDLGLRPHMGTGQMVFTDAYGNKSYQQYDKGSYYYGDNSPIKEPVTRQNPLINSPGGTTPSLPPGQPVFGDRKKSVPNKVAGSVGGYGGMIGTPEKGIKFVDDAIEKYGKDVSQVVSAREELRSLEPILKNKNSSPREQAIAIQALVQASTVETKMTDADVERVTGANLRPVIDDLLDMIQRKGIGGLSEYERQNAIAASKTLIKRADRIEQFYRSKLAKRVKAIPGGSRYAESQGYTPKTESTQAKEKKVSKAAELAAKKFPNDPEKQQRFIQFVEGNL